MIAQWADPSWKALLTNDQGQSHPTDIIALEGGWQGLMIPSPGVWTLKFNYKPASATWGMRISSLSWILLITVSLCLRLPRLSANQVALPESPIKTNS
jgi:hypothetical protein